MADQTHDAGGRWLEPTLPHVVNSSGNSLPISSSNPIPVSLTEPVGGGVTWGAPTSVAMTGASTTLVAANTLRKALMIINPVGNTQASYSLSGSAVTLAGGIPLLSSGKDTYTGSDCPVGIVTFIGATTTQSVVYVEGT